MGEYDYKYNYFDCYVYEFKSYKSMQIMHICAIRASKTHGHGDACPRKIF